MIVHQVVGKANAIRQTISELSYAESLVQHLAELCQAIQPLCETIEGTVDWAAVARHEYRVLPAFDPRLTEVAQRRERLEGEIEDEFNRIASRLGLEAGKRIKLENSPVHGGHYCRVSRLDWDLVKDGEFQELSTQKNGVYFVNRAMRDLTLQISDLAKLFNQQQSSIVTELTGMASGYREALLLLNECLGQVDLLQSLAHAAALAPRPLCRPTFDTNVPLLLNGCRHPCVEAMLSAGRIEGGARHFIANDVSFESAKLLLITGPNMGGKSTVLRQTAMACLMAQMGCLVAADSARIPLFDAIMVRVGAGDNVMRGISTFMAEMLETASILDGATDCSLVLIDELGRGTSTSEGIGLAWGVCRWLAERIGCHAFFATHFQELTRISQQVKGIENWHLAMTNLSFEYRLQRGVCERSLGVQVARMAGLPTEVTLMAAVYLAQLEGISVETEAYLRQVVPLFRENDVKAVLASNPPPPQLSLILQ